MAAQQPKNTPSFAGQFLKEYRKQNNNISQEQLAYDLNIEARTLRAYENGERQLNNIVGASLRETLDKGNKEI